MYICVYILYIEEELLYVFICFSLTVAEAKVTAHSESESAGDLLISVCVLQSFLGGILFPCPFTKVHQGKMCFLNLDSKLQPVFMQCRDPRNQQRSGCLPDWGYGLVADMTIYE